MVPMHTAHSMGPKPRYVPRLLSKAFAMIILCDSDSVTVMIVKKNISENLILGSGEGGDAPMSSLQTA